MGLSSLDAALSGLRASQKQLSVISNNVSNVNTPGYTRKTLPQAAQSLNGVTVGVATQTIIRNVDMNLTRDLWTQESSVGGLEIKQTYLSKIESFHGSPDAEISVAAEISRLRNSFSALSDTPEDTFLQAQTVASAQKTAQKINNLGNLINTLRNDAQSDLTATVDRVNQLLVQIADLNDQVQDNMNMRRSTAATEDQRDEAIKELAGLIDISFFKRGDGVLVVQTKQGVELADTNARKLMFNPMPLGVESYYPDSAAGIYVVNNQFTGNPVTSPQAINITEAGVGGRMGGLLELRDQDFPTQMAQLDELAHKMALRFQAQGLTLFTDETGSVPPDTAPDPTTVPPTTVSYVGFSLTMQVNPSILQDHSLLQKGTYGATNIQVGSGEVIRRVIEYTFGDVEYQEVANNNAATQVDLMNTGGADLQTWLGLFSSNSVVAGRSIGDGVIDDPDGLGGASSIDVLVASAAGMLDDPNDQFTITFDQPGLVPPALPVTITVDLSAVSAASTGQNAAQEIVNYINNQIALAAPDSRLGMQAVVTNSGQIAIRGNAEITIDASGPNGMGQDGLTHLGLQQGTTVSSNDPYFDVKIGDQNPVRITIAPGETATDLLAKLRAQVPNLAVDIDANGNLVMRPGDDNTMTHQSFGGDIQIIGGPFTTRDAAYTDTAAPGTRASIDDGVNIVSALFGNYTITGGVVNNIVPITNYAYGSEVSASNTTTTSFRNGLLGPGANLSAGIVGSNRLIDFSQKLVNQQASQVVSIKNAISDESSLKEILQTQLLNESGVNIDEELSHLVVVQTAFSAAARVVSAVDEMFRELLNAF